MVLYDYQPEINLLFAFFEKELKKCSLKNMFTYPRWLKKNTFFYKFYLIEKMKEFPKKVSWNKSATMKNIMLFLEMKKKLKREPFFWNKRQVLGVYETYMRGLSYVSC